MKSAKDHRNRISLPGALITLTLLLLTASAPASAAIGPKWRLDAFSNTTVAPGEELQYYVQATNVGEAPVSDTTWHAELPTGMVATSAKVYDSSNALFDACTDASDGVSPVDGASSVVCTTSIPVPPSSVGYQRLLLTVKIGSTAIGTLTTQFEVSGGDAKSVKTIDPVAISSQPPGFGVDALDTNLSADVTGSPLTKAGAHPYDYTTWLDFNTLKSPDPIEGDLWPVEPPKSVIADLPPGLVGNPAIANECTIDQLASMSGQFIPRPLCPSASQVGTTLIRLKGAFPGSAVIGPLPVFNMKPPPGVPARFSFNIIGTLIVLDAELRSEGDYGLSVTTTIPQGLEIAGNTITFWGVPSSSDHDPERACPGQENPWQGAPHCTSGASEQPFFRLPTSCPEGQAASLPTSIRVDSWVDPGDFVKVSAFSHEQPGYPSPQSEWGDAAPIEDCEEVPVKGSLEAKPTARDAETSSGLTVRVEVPNPGMKNPEGIASSDLKKVEVSLPRGITINPSQAEGLGVCMPAQYESTELSFLPTTKGCPDDSKIGTVAVKTPLLHETVEGDVYVAQQDDPGTSTPGAENPFDSLLAIYVVLHNEQRGILIKLPGEVDLEDPAHPGQIVTTFENLPQLPFDSFDFKFREGARAPLVTPPACGDYTTETEITGWSDPGNPIVSKSSFRIDRGIGGGPCPPSGTPPFKPGFSAGSVNPSAGLYSPFTMRLTRNDGEQDLTKFSSILPSGVSAKIAGVEKCTDAAIAGAKGKTGRQELAAPSCPAGSRIGRSLAGAGVGSVLTYVPGSIYLAGPYQGAPLSVVAITPAVAGPFDVGTVVVREALTLDPVTAEVHVDGDKSDPIPHILKGIPLKLRDLRIYVDRENFTINPTSCDPTAVKGILFGSYADVFSPGDDVPVALSSRYQAANCASLGFKPKLALNLKGGNRRGGHPGLKAIVTPRKGDTNIGKAVVKLPRSAFLDQAHIRTICTRVQFAADACPKGAQYGYVKAWTPLLDEPLEGPVWLRSSNNKLPDLIFDLHGIVDIEVAGRIDSIRGGIRTTFEGVPDAPVSRLVLQMQGGKKGLIQNSRNLCAGTNKAGAQFDGQSGKPYDFRPVVRPDCGKRKRAR
jgi:uncharacterized repeat protein (TIGR01451 family)